MPKLHYSFLDRCLIKFDQGLRVLLNKPNSSRPSPAALILENQLSPSEKKYSARLIRVDHVGEICAQALYQGQALTAGSITIKQNLEQSAREENDHLAWCAERLKELNDRTSYLKPFWYFNSLLIGMIAGIAGDKWSLGFVVETEKQVMKHLADHLQRLPATDQKSQYILQQMYDDEAHHASVALANGAAELPEAVKKIMTIFAKIMTTTAYWI